MFVSVASLLPGCDALAEAILGLAGMEVILPTAALTVQCFLLAARRVLITHQCFDYS